MSAVITDFEYRVGRLNMQSGDVLVIKVNERLCREVGERVRKFFQQYLPPETKLMVIDRDVDLSILTGAELAKRLNEDNAAA